jgi:hypothetical protein
MSADPSRPTASSATIGMSRCQLSAGVMHSPVHLYWTVQQHNYRDSRIGTRRFARNLWRTDQPLTRCDGEHWPTQIL